MTTFLKLCIHNADVTCGGYGIGKTYHNELEYFKQGEWLKGIEAASVGRGKALVHIPVKLLGQVNNIVHLVSELIVAPLIPGCTCVNENGDSYAKIWGMIVKFRVNSLALALLTLPLEVVAILSPEIACKIFRLHKLAEKGIVLHQKLLERTSTTTLTVFLAGRSDGKDLHSAISLSSTPYDDSIGSAIDQKVTAKSDDLSTTPRKSEGYSNVNLFHQNALVFLVGEWDYDSSTHKYNYSKGSFGSFKVGFEL